MFVMERGSRRWVEPRPSANGPPQGPPLRCAGAGAHSCPLSGGCRPQGGWGLFQRQSGPGQRDVPQRCNPHRFAEPPERGHKGLAALWWAAPAAQERAGTSTLRRTCDGALRVGYIGEGAFPLREQRISASPMRRFLPPFFWAARERRLGRSQVTAAAGQALAFVQTTCSANA